VTILLVEQNMMLAKAVADELHIMVKGRMVYRATRPSSAQKKRQSGPAFSRCDRKGIKARTSGNFRASAEFIMRAPSTAAS
jgi:hypothetical protein